MIKRLYLNDCFRHFDKTFTFGEGLLAIVGPNESGKSLILEMIRYALFGSAALRGNADGYKRLHVELDFQVSEQTYRAVRRSGKASLSLLPSGQEIAVGTKPVNAAITRLLGYDLEVFDVAHACNQGQVEKLGSMRASDRKAMVDQTIGLNDLDALADSVAEQTRATRALHDSLVSRLVAPTAPTQPAGYRPSSELVRDLNAVKPLVDEYRRLEGFLAHPAPIAPQQPTTNEQRTSIELKQLIDSRAAVLRRQQQLQAQLSGLPLPRFSAEEVADLEKKLVLYRLWQERQAFEKAGKVPKYTVEQLAVWEADWELIDAASARARVEDAIANSDKLSCPECKHEWHLHAEHVAALRKQLDALPVVVLVPAEPPLSNAMIAHERRNLDRFGDDWNRLKNIPEAENPGVSESDLQLARQCQDNVARRAAIEAELAAIVVPEDVSSTYQERVAYERHLAEYQQATQTYSVRKAEREQKQARFNELVGVVDRFEAIQLHYHLAVAYESELTRYTTAKEKYDADLVEIEALEQKAQEYGRAREALKELRLRVKQYLVPSLSRVASSLLSQMTGGQRNLIEVNEDFEVKVDGQQLEVLSGSGKAVANLAIRIALGQVLTNKMLSLFMGDEIDASMDTDRATFTAECLKNLTGSVKQVILVSHKRPEADQYIDLAA